MKFVRFLKYIYSTKKLVRMGRPTIRMHENRRREKENNILSKDSKEITLGEIKGNATNKYISGIFVLGVP